MAFRGVGFPELVGVATEVVAGCGVWAEMGVVGDVDVAYSDGGAWVDGVSDRVRGPSKVDSFALGVALGVETALGDASASASAWFWAARSALASC